MAQPKVLKNFNLYLNAVTLIGKVDEVTLPDLTIITEDHRAGGMDAAVKLDMGMETPELGFTCSEHSPEIYKRFGLKSQNGVQAVFRGAMMDNQEATPYVVTVNGMMTNLNSGTVSTGNKNTLEGTISCRYYKLEIAGEVVIEIDIDNQIRIIDGVDQLESMRAALIG